MATDGVAPDGESALFVRCFSIVLTRRDVVATGRGRAVAAAARRVRRASVVAGPHASVIVRRRPHSSWLALQDRCLALSHVTSPGKIGHGIVVFNGVGYRLEETLDLYPTVAQLMRSLPLRFDVVVATPAATSTPAAAPALSRDSVSVRDSYVAGATAAAAAGSGDPDVTTKLNRIRKALLQIVDDLEKTTARIAADVDAVRCCRCLCRPVLIFVFDL